MGLQWLATGAAVAWALQLGQREMRIVLPSNPMGAEITHLDVRTIGASEIDEIKHLLYHRRLIVFRGQALSEVEYIEFAKKLGRPQIYLQANYHHPLHPEIFVSSNETYQGKKFGVRGTGRYWHTDYSFMPEPLPLTMVRPVTLPNGLRETYYVDMARVLEEMPLDLRTAVEGKHGIHEGKYRYKVQESDIDRSLAEILEECSRLAPAVAHPAVIVHPVTGERILYLNRGFTTRIDGVAEETLQRIFEFIERPEHIYTHRWNEEDIVLWDNRYLIHKASTVPAGEKSTTYRIGVYDGLPFYVTEIPECETRSPRSA